MELDKLALYRETGPDLGRRRPGARRRGVPGIDLGLRRRGRRAQDRSRRWRCSSACSATTAGAGPGRRPPPARSASCSSSAIAWPTVRTLAAAATAMGINSEYRGGDARGQARNWTTAELADALDGLVELDALVKGAPGTLGGRGAATTGVHALGDGPRGAPRAALGLDRDQAGSVGGGPGLFLDDEVALDGEDAAALAEVEQLDQVRIDVELRAVLAQAARDAEAQPLAPVGQPERRVEPGRDEPATTGGAAISQWATCADARSRPSGHGMTRRYPVRPADGPLARPRLLDAQDGLRLGPVLLEPVVVALGRREDVDDDRPEVEQDPVRRRRPLATDRLGLLVAQRADDAVRDGVELALRPARADDEVVGERRQRRSGRAARCRPPSCPRRARRSAGEVERSRSAWARACRGVGRPSALGAIAAEAAIGACRGRSRCRAGPCGLGPLRRQRGFGHDRSSLLVGSIAAHGRRYSRRPHPARGSAASGRRPPGSRSSEADSRSRGPSRKTARAGDPREVLGRGTPGSASGYPSRGATASRASSSTRRGSCQVGSSSERLRGEDEREVRRSRPRAPRACRRCTTGPAGPARSGCSRRPGCRRWRARPSRADAPRR